MNILPAIDLIGGKAVRLKKGDYNQVTVYNDNPLAVAKSFEEQGASFLHVVDLDGAKEGSTANFSTIERIVKATSLSVEIGGGIRNMETVKRYMDIGVDRVIIGTAAVTDPDFLHQAVMAYGERIAVGIDIKDRMVAIKGWMEISAIDCDTFCKQVQDIGVKTIICTDISKDGMMAGTNLALYRDLCHKFTLNIIASGGVSTTTDVHKLKEIGVWGAILGKALYTNSISLSEAIAIGKESQ